MKILKQFQVILITLCILQLSSYQVISAHSFEAMNYVEAFLGASRGPLSALSFHKENKSKVLQSFTSVVRIAHEACAIINHAGDSSYSMGIRATWMAFDTVNFYDKLLFKNQDEKDGQIKTSFNDEEIIDRLIRKSQLLLLPAIESITALYQASNIEQTPQRSINQRRAQALCSLARATSIFLDNRQSKAALILLIATLNETMLAINEKALLNNQVNTNQENIEQNLVLEGPQIEIVEQQARDEQVQENQEPVPTVAEHEQAEEPRPEIETLRTQIAEQFEQIQLQLRQEQQAREEQLRHENEALRHQNELIANRYQRLEEAHHQTREQLNRIQENEARRTRSAREARARIETARLALRQEIERSGQVLREARETREESNRFLEQERITGELIDQDPDIQTMNEFDTLIGANATIAQLQDFVNNIASK